MPEIHYLDAQRLQNHGGDDVKPEIYARGVAGNNLYSIA